MSKKLVGTILAAGCQSLKTGEKVCCLSLPHCSKPDYGLNFSLYIVLCRQ